MYNAFFEFEETPFAARPNLAFFYRSKQHDTALRSLSFAVQARMGLSSLTGEEGTGKTMVLECLRDSLEGVQIQCAFLRDSRISTNRLFQTIASELDLRCQASADQVSSALHQFTLHQAKKGRTVALIVDEAHNLPTDVLNAILHLTSQHDNKVKLLQTVLAGHPALNVTLDALNLEPLRQHTVLSCGLEPFTPQEAHDYIEFRLTQAGMPEQTIFPPEVIAQICDRSRGFAPAIHSLCDGLLRAAFSVESKVCTQEILDLFFNPPCEEQSDLAETATLAAATEIDLSRLASLSEPDAPAMHFALLRLVFNILPRLSRSFAINTSELLVPQESALLPFLPTCDSALPAAEMALGSNKLMPLADGAQAGRKGKRQRPGQRKAALPPSPSIVPATPIDFAGILLQPSRTTGSSLLAPSRVTRLAPLTQSTKPNPGIIGYVVPEAISLQSPASFGPMHPAAMLEPAGIEKRPSVPVPPFAMATYVPPSPRIGPDTQAHSVNLETFVKPAISAALTASPELSVWEQHSLLPLACSVSPIAAPTGTPLKPRLTALESLQPWGPESRLEPITPRRHSLQQPAWTTPEEVSAEVAPIRIKKPISFNRAWLATFAVTIFAGLALYSGSPAVRTAADTMNHGLRHVQQAVADRAAVGLDEDFRSGLNNWTNRGSGHPSWPSDAAGFVHPAALALYRPSLGLTDYQMQFVGTIDKKGLSWVVRATDFNNYYAVGLTVLKPGPVPTIGLTRYAVINGKTQDRVTTPLMMSARLDTVYRVSLDVHGDDFALSVQDQLVDTWSDSKLRHGGIGFFSEQDAASRIAGVQVRSQYDMLGRLCAALAPSGASSYRASGPDRAAITD